MVSMNKKSCTVFIKPDQMDLDLTPFKEVDIVEYDESKSTLLVLDDVDFIIDMYQFDMKSMMKSYQYDLTNDYNMCYIVSKDCGYRALKFLRTTRIPIDLAFLDLSLGYVYLDNKGNVVEIDGIDVAYELKKFNPNAKIYFYTAHRFDNRSPMVDEFIQKYYSFFQDDITKYVINKDTTRLNKIYNIVRNND